jgi:glycosyltransferase involved in cell wall biosynthesis
MAKKSAEKKILFIGSFILPKNGSFGGVYFASMSIKPSLNKNNIKVIELDTTLEDINKINISGRLHKILLRNVIFCWKIFINWRAKNLLIFLSAGNSYLDKLPAVLLAKLLNKKVIIFPVSGLIINDFNKLFYRVVIKLVMQKADIIICQSEYWKAFFTGKSVNPNKMVVVENWVSDETLSKSKMLSFPNFNKEIDLFKIIYVSRIEIAKGVIDLIELAKALAGEIAFEINVYGDGSYKEQFQLAIEDNKLENLVKFKGWLKHEDIQEVTNAHHIALFTSRFEGYPNALLDFIFSKTPIVTTNILSIEAMGKKGVTYYEPGNIQELKEKILGCHENYEDAINMARGLLKEKFKLNNIEFSTRKIIDLLK